MPASGIPVPASVLMPLFPFQLLAHGRPGKGQWLKGVGPGLDVRLLVQLGPTLQDGDVVG